MTDILERYRAYICTPRVLAVDSGELMRDMAAELERCRKSRGGMSNLPKIDSEGLRLAKREGAAADTTAAPAKLRPDAQTIPEQAVEAAAKAIATHDDPYNEWDDLQPYWHEQYREEAKVALVAAQPLMGVQREELARRLRILLQAGGNLSGEEIETLERNILALPWGVQRPKDVAVALAAIRKVADNLEAMGVDASTGTIPTLRSAADTLALPHTGQPQEGDTEATRYAARVAGKMLDTYIVSGDRWFKEAADLIQSQHDQLSALSAAPASRPKGEPHELESSGDGMALGAVDWTPASPRAEGEWQPIETAPKDGTRIIAYSAEAPGSKIRTTWWRDPKKDQCGYTGWGEFNLTYWPPSHWRPLPAPPVIAEPGPLPSSRRMDDLKARGVGRDAQDERFLSIAFNRRPTDDELRAVQTFLRRSPATCPFCRMPTYSLPCSHCGEPDIPSDFEGE